MFRFFLLLTVLHLLSCSSISEEGKNIVQFRLLPSEDTGIDFSNDLIDTPELNIIEYLYYYNGAGVAVADINNDGLEDLFFTGNQVPNRLYLNEGGMKFRDISTAAGINTGKGWSTGVVAADVNADGWMDFYVCQVGNFQSLRGHNLLFINNGDNTFTESAKTYGLDFSGFSTQAAFFDFDRDGDLDLYLLNHAVHTPRSYQPAAYRDSTDGLAGDRFFENISIKGKPGFQDITRKSGIYSSPQGYGLGLVIADMNEDGWPDIYVGNDFHENDYLYLNNHNGTFTEKMADFLPHTSRFSMGVDIADMTNDGLPEIFGLDMLPSDPATLLKSGGEDSEKVSEIKKRYGYHPQFARNTFQLNHGNSRFSDIALMTNTYATDWSWSVLLADLNNDGLRDIFIANGIVKRPNDLDYINFLSNVNLARYQGKQLDSVRTALIAKMPAVKIPNVAFQQMDSLVFKETTNRWSLDEPSWSNGAVYADLDNDGDLDLVISNINQRAFVYENLSPENYHFIAFDCRDQGQPVVGVKLKIFHGCKLQQAQNYTVRGFMSSVTHRLHFGLGNHATVDSVHIFWPDGIQGSMYQLNANTHYTIEKDSLSPVLIDIGLPDRQADWSKMILPFEHVEDDFKDYDREPLIPHTLTREGPALALGDVTGDGQEEIFIGGAHGQPSVLLRKVGNSYLEIPSEIFQMDKFFEDVDATFLDIDLDGDLDLYVVSGGNRFRNGEAGLSDRLYINNGKGLFTKSKIELPKANGSVVCVGDVNGDAYPDIFVGSSAMPGSYGVLPENYLLINNQKGGFDQPVVIFNGMVSDAKFADMDGNGSADLVLAGEWMPLTILKNQKGEFSKRETISGSAGLWRSLQVADINRDGMMDIVAGNIGLNTKLKASSEQPLGLYVGDFDGNKQVEPILFHYFMGISVPFATKDQLISQMPMLKKRYLSYESFSSVSSFSELMGAEFKREYQQYEVNTIASTVYLNSINGFQAVALPFHAQLSPINDLLLMDWNEDGHIDVVSAGNFHPSIVNRGNYNGNPGAIYLGDGSGIFQFSEFLPLDFSSQHNKIRQTANGIVVGTNNQSSVNIQRK